MSAELYVVDPAVGAEFSRFARRLRELRLKGSDASSLLAHLSTAFAQKSGMTRGEFFELIATLWAQVEVDCASVQSQGWFCGAERSAAGARAERS